MEIKPRDVTIKNLLESGFYKIPRFQRAYSWDRANVEDFWNDAVVAEDPDYFIGSFVLFTGKGIPDLYFIVDGQQRLTTITLLLAAIRDELDRLGHKPQATGVQKLIEREDLNNQLQFVLASETPYPYFQEHIQKFRSKEAVGSLGAEEEALRAAYRYLRDMVVAVTAAIENDPSITKEKKKLLQREKLLGIRDKVLKLQLIIVQLGNEDDAYLIFETLNTRGKDLTVADLVKNHITRQLKPTHHGVDRTKDKWHELLDLFDASEVDLNINRFLHHTWLSRHAYTTEKLLYKEIRKAVTKTNAAKFLDDLLADAILYRHIFEPTARQWSKQERHVADSLRALALFRVVQPVPMLLSLLRSYAAKEITLRQLSDILSSMEDFHVQFTAVTAQRTGGGTAFMYALSARELCSASEKNRRARVLREFRTKLRTRIPSYEEFEAGFTEIQFSDGNTKQRQLVRYLLRRIDQHLRKSAPPDYDQFSIEHLAPQNPANGPAVAKHIVGMLGNLLFVPEALNGDLKNGNWKQKRTLLKQRDVPLDPSLAKATTWNENAIIERTKRLATLLYRDILSV